MKKNFFCLVLVMSLGGWAAESFSSGGKLKGLFWMGGFPRASRMNSSQFNNYLSKMDSNLKNNKYLDGVQIAIPWKAIEKSDNQFDFSRVDKVVALAEKYDINFKLLLVPGLSCPDYIYKKGVEKFETIDNNKYHRDDYGKAKVMPLPWDKKYQQYYFRAVSAMADRYRNKKNFISISITGVNFTSPEMHLPRTPADRKKWAKIPDHKEKIEAAWKVCIDQFAHEFPNQYIGLEVSLPLPGMEANVDNIINYGIEKYPKRFFIQTDQLNGRHDNKRVYSYSTVLKFKDKLVNGFQNVSGWAYPQTAKRQGDFDQTIKNFKYAEAEYYEVWYGDGMRQDICKKIKESIWSNK